MLLLEPRNELLDKNSGQTSPWLIKKSVPSMTREGTLHADAKIFILEITILHDFQFD